MIEQIIKDVTKIYQAVGKEKRLHHVLGVRDTALQLGKLHGCALEKLEIASLLHDITKYQPYEYHKKIIEENFQNSTKILQEHNKQILHAFSARIYAMDKYNIKDEDILGAIENHTVGKDNMSIYEQIVFISDYIEPNRTYDSCVKVRNIAFENLDLATYTAIDDSIVYYENIKALVPSTCYKAREYYKQLLEVQHGKN